jgi:nitroreductase
VMTVQEAIEARRSIRKFTTQPVSQAQVDALLEAARLAPSSVNRQPWRFKIVQELVDMQWLSGSPTKSQRWIAGAGLVLVCCADVQRYLQDSTANVRFLKDSGLLSPEMRKGLDDYVFQAETAPPEVLRWAAAANCSIAITQMMLRAVELGLGTCWVGMFDETALKQRFAIPEDMPVVALLVVGHPAEKPTARKRRKLEDIVLP